MPQDTSPNSRQIILLRGEISIVRFTCNASGYLAQHIPRYVKVAFYKRAILALWHLTHISLLLHSAIKRTPIGYASPRRAPPLAA